MIPHKTLEVFSQLWWQSNIVTVSIIFIFLLVGKLINLKNKEIVAKFIGTILISRSIGVHFYWDYLGIWNIQSSLPLHLCGISAILSGIVLFWRNQLAYECLFYWGITGAFHSLLTPEFTIGMDGLLFYEYYLSHGGILLSALYLTIVIGMKPRFGSWWKIFLFSQLLIPIIGSINWYINANYMYLCIKPIANNPFLIGEWPWYIIGIEFAALIHFFIIYIPVKLNYKKQ
tara:strand:+ start:138 stop:827 length:690 start_codon:yes stop_codon:yes gene_type:complete